MFFTSYIKPPLCFFEKSKVVNIFPFAIFLNITINCYLNGFILSGPRARLLKNLDQGSEKKSLGLDPADSFMFFSNKITLEDLLALMIRGERQTVTKDVGDHGVTSQHTSMHIGRIRTGLQCATQV